MNVDTSTSKPTRTHDEAPTRPVLISTAEVMLGIAAATAATPATRTRWMWARRLFVRRGYRRDFYFEEPAMAREMYRL